jgi:signal transduction histidine kinase
MHELRSFFRVQRRFLLLASLCALFSIVAGAYFIRYLLKPSTGLVVEQPSVVMDDGRALFAPRSRFSPAIESGLLPGKDRILAIDGVPVGSSRDVLQADARVRGFDPVIVAVQRDTGEIRTLRILPAFALTRLDSLFVLVFCASLLSVAWLLSWRLPIEPGTLPLVLAALCYLVSTCVKPFSFESLLSNALIQLGGIAPWLLVLFALVHPWRRGTKMVRRAAVLSLLALFVVFCAARLDLFARWMSTGDEAVLDRYLLLGRIGNVADGAAYLALAALLASAYARASSEAMRARLRWILAGIMIALPPYFFLEQLPLIMGGMAAPVGLGAFAQLFLSFIPAFILIALTGHRALDLRSFMARYAIYAALLLAAIASFAILYLPLRDLIAREYRPGAPVAEMLAAGAIVLMLAAARLARVQGRSEPRGFSLPPRGDLERASPPAAAGRQNLFELRALLSGIATTLREPVQAIVAPRSGPSGTDAMDSAASIGGFLRVLETITGPRASIFGSASTREIVQRALERVKRRYPDALFAVDTGSPMRVSCYPEEIVQALSLVLENAVEAHQAETNPIAVRVVADHARVGMEVSDRGAGIQGRAFRRLYSPFNTTKPGHYGLGLYVAKALVERSRGTLELLPGAQGGVRALIAFRAPAEEMQ